MKGRFMKGRLMKGRFFSETIMTLPRPCGERKKRFHTSGPGQVFGIQKGSWEISHEPGEKSL